MEKRMSTKVDIQVTKVAMKTGEDWNSPPQKDLPMGVYLGELPEGALCLWVTDEFGGRYGWWLPIGVMLDIREGEKEKGLVKALSEIGAKLDSVELATDEVADVVKGSTEVRSEQERVLLNMVEAMHNNLCLMMGKIEDLQKNAGSSKSSLTEMGEVVVNIIKATK